MIFQNLKSLIWLLIFCVVFYLGMLFQGRENVASSPNNIQLIAENNYIQNSLIYQLNTQSIYGFDSNGRIQPFGYMLYKQVDQDNLEIVIMLQNLPENFVGAGGARIPFPNRLTLGYSRLCCDNQDLEILSLPTEDSPAILSVENSGQIKTATISTSINFNLFDDRVESFFLYAQNENKEKIMSPYIIQEDPRKEWPLRFRQKNFPFLWTYL